jgi:3-oxoacyl-[acyl-carrier-protein] synthase III
MRTTVILEDSVFQKAKKRAVEVGTTLSDLTNSALRHFLAERSLREGDRFVMPVFGGGGKCHQTPAQLAKLRDEGR